MKRMCFTPSSSEQERVINLAHKVSGLTKSEFLRRAVAHGADAAAKEGAARWRATTDAVLEYAATYIEQKAPVTKTGSEVDLETAEQVAEDPWLSGHVKLFRTGDGKFWLETREIWVDGYRLRGDVDPQDVYIETGIVNPRLDPRVDRRKHVQPMTPRQALEWCIKTQIPETFRGYLLESL